MGYSTDGWGEFFICAGGAAAALSGLIFVALSINIGTVLEIEKREGGGFLTGRALEALAALLSVLAISIVALTPAINRGVLAAFLLVVSVETLISPTRAALASRATGRLPVTTVARLVQAGAMSLVLILAGVTLAAHHGGGLLWLPAAFVLAIMVAGVNAWILLVEVLR